MAGALFCTCVWVSGMRGNGFVVKAMIAAAFAVFSAIAVADDGYILREQLANAAQSFLTWYAEATKRQAGVTALRFGCAPVTFVPAVIVTLICNNPRMLSAPSLAKHSNVFLHISSAAGAIALVALDGVRMGVWKQIGLCEGFDVKSIDTETERFGFPPNCLQSLFDNAVTANVCNANALVPHPAALDALWACLLALAINGFWKTAEHNSSSSAKREQLHEHITTQPTEQTNCFAMPSKDVSTLSTPIVVLSRLSFGCNACNVLVVHYLAGALTTYPLQPCWMRVIAESVVALVLVVLCSFATYVAIERPALRFIRWVGWL